MASICALTTAPSSSWKRLYSNESSTEHIYVERVMRIRVHRRWRVSPASAFFLAMGLSLFAGALGAMAHSRWIEYQDRKAFLNLVESYPPTSSSPREGSSVAIVNIPRLNLSVLVRSGVSS